MPTKIEWCQETISPLPGCTKISEGCQNCYAIRMANRFKGTPKYHGLVKNGNWAGHTNWWPTDLEKPLRWKKPRQIFVNSMGDLFHKGNSWDRIAAVFGVMAFCQSHTFIVLTKRPDRMRFFFNRFHHGSYASNLNWWKNAACSILPEKLTRGIRLRPTPTSLPLPNVWLGVTAENQLRADERIPILLQIPAAVRFVSVEPMLSAIQLPRVNFHCDRCGGTGILARWPKGKCNYCDGKGEIPAISTDPRFGTPSTPMRKIDWVICGGESGPGARPMNPDWARSLKDQCVAAGVPFHFKQWGEWVDEWHPAATPEVQKTSDAFVEYVKDDHGHDIDYIGFYMCRVGKKAAGRQLDGRTWDQYPVIY